MQVEPDLPLNLPRVPARPPMETKQEPDAHITVEAVGDQEAEFPEFGDICTFA
jgi:hypothetical protein